jgi:phosphodiesterase/alkaline phosphatase D-like protein
VVLTWTDNSTNESGFRLERSKTADFATVTGTNLAANVTTVTQTGLVRNTTYYYRIRTRNGTIISGVWVSATPLPILTNP